MSSLHPDYQCKCSVPHPLHHESRNGEDQDTGLCVACNGVYDERLYEMRIRENVHELPAFETLDELLRKIDPRYQQLVRASV